MTKDARADDDDEKGLSAGALDAQGSQARVMIAIVIGLIAAGAFLSTWTQIAGGTPGHLNAIHVSAELFAGVPIAFALWAFLPTNRWIGRGLDRIRKPTPWVRRTATIAITLGSACAFYFAAVWQGRSLVPTWHDSNMHMVQAQLIAHGKLWAAPHPLADQLETFFVFVKPVYAAIHFPGTSMLYAPLLMLGTGPAVYSSLMAGAVVGLSYRVISEVIDGVAGVLVVPILLGIPQLRMVSVMLLSHHVVLVPILLSLWASLHWRRSIGGDLRWACAIGCLIGFAGLTRPVEALAYAVPTAIAMTLTLRGMPWRRWLATAIVMAIAASPWIAIQLEFDRHVTGQWLQVPYEYYNHLFHPGLSYGGSLQPQSASIIPTNLPQKIDYYETFITKHMTRYTAVGAVETLVGDRLPMALGSLTPNPLMIALWSPALLGLVTRERRIFAGATAIYFLLCLPYAIFPAHYALAAAPFAAMMPALGVHVIGRTFPGRRRSIEVFVVTLLFLLSIASLPFINPSVRDPIDGWAKANLYVNTMLANDVRQPAILLSRYRRSDQHYDAAIDQPFDEPVYTIDALWPEDSPIARFQDLGPARNREIYAFFAKRREDRSVYLLDRRSGGLTSLGTVDDLLACGEPPVYFEQTAPSVRPTQARTRTAGVP